MPLVKFENHQDMFGRQVFAFRELLFKPFYVCLPLRLFFDEIRHLRAFVTFSSRSVFFLLVFRL